MTAKEDGAVEDAEERAGELLFEAEGGGATEFLLEVEDRGWLVLKVIMLIVMNRGSKLNESVYWELV